MEQLLRNAKRAEHAVYLHQAEHGALAHIGIRVVYHLHQVFALLQDRIHDLLLRFVPHFWVQATRVVDDCLNSCGDGLKKGLEPRRLLYLKQGGHALR